MKPEKLIYSEDNNRFYEHDQLGIVVADSSIYGSDNEQYEFQNIVPNPTTLFFSDRKYLNSNDSETRSHWDLQQI